MTEEGIPYFHIVLLIFAFLAMIWLKIEQMNINRKKTTDCYKRRPKKDIRKWDMKNNNS